MQGNYLFPITLTCYLSFSRCRLQVPVLKKKKGWKPNLEATPVTSAASHYLKNATTAVWLPPEVTQPQAPSDKCHLKSNTIVFWQLIFWGGHEYFLLGDFLRENVWLLLHFLDKRDRGLVYTTWAAMSCSACSALHPQSTSLHTTDHHQPLEVNVCRGKRNSAMVNQ